VLRMARENPPRATDASRASSSGFGHHVAASTVWTILKNAGIDPAPLRSGPTRRQFLTAQAHELDAVDPGTAPSALGRGGVLGRRPGQLRLGPVVRTDLTDTTHRSHRHDGARREPRRRNGGSKGWKSRRTG
jgi:hypothetical protein